MILLDNQQKAYNKLKRLKVGALFMEAGTGKTLTAIKLIESTNTDYCVFIVPFQTKQNLKDELTKWNFKMKHDIIGIESLSNSDNLYMDYLLKISKNEHVFLVVDESLKIKNEQAKRTERVMKFAELSEYRLILNGTPLSKNVIDLWTQMEFLSPKILGMGKDQFINTFVDYVQFKGDRGWSQKIIKKFSNMEYLYSLIDPFVFDAKLDLNKHKQYIDVPYKVTDVTEYEAIKESYLEDIRRGSGFSFLGMTQKMQQSYCVDTGKLAALKELVKNSDQSKTLVYCKFIKSKDMIEQLYPNIKVMTYGKGSLGLNLQAYNHIIFYDKTFDYAQREQAEHRIYRVGQESNVIYHSLSADVGLDSLIQKNIDKKVSMLNYFKKMASESKVEVIFNEL